MADTFPLSAGLLESAATPAVARLALALLDAARAADARVRADADPEALHDFRVALRRLRSVLRSFRPALEDAVSKKLRNALRDLARSTTAARDTEVWATWIKDLEPELPPAKRRGVPWLLAQLVERRAHAYQEIRRDTAREFRDVERRLRKALAPAAKREGRGRRPEPRYGETVADLVTDHAALLEQELAAVDATTDDAAVHRARITVKRLRYLLEPLTDTLPRAAEIVPQLKQLQTLLGEIHDLHLLAVELVEAIATAAAVRARHQHDRLLGDRPAARTKGPRPATTGLLALARAVQEARVERLRRVTADWSGAPLANLLNACAVLTTNLTIASTSLQRPA